MPEARRVAVHSNATQRAGKGTLYVVATPIGNLDDITLRALKTFKTVQLVAAEDTRRTGNLLRHFDIEVPILSVHGHNEHGRIERVLSHLDRGDSVALVTDAGTPAISDPGAALVAAVRTAGYRVEPIPGPSAVAAAFSASGIASDGFVFLGFPPIKAKARNNWWQVARRYASERAVVIFEAPHKVIQTVSELANYVEWPIFVARELTKVHEEFIWATPAALGAILERPQGEFTIIIPPEERAHEARVKADDESIAHLFGEITKNNSSGSRRADIKQVAAELGMTSKDVYNALERHKLGQTTE